MSGEQRSLRRDVGVALLVFFVACALRTMFLFDQHYPQLCWPNSWLYEGDAPVWQRWAHALSRGEPFEFDLPLRTPGVAWLLDGFGFRSGDAKFVWCAFSATTCAATYFVAARWISHRVAWIAAALLVFSFGQYQLATSLNNEAPYGLLCVLIVAATLRWMREPTVVVSLAIGVLSGLAMLLRAEHVLGFAALAVFAVLARDKGAVALGRAFSRTALCALAAVAVCLPWALRSHAAVQRFNTEAPPIEYAHAQPPWTPAARAFLDGLPAFSRAGNFAFAGALAREHGAAQVDEPDLVAFFEREWAYVPEPLDEWTLVCSKGALDFALANHPEAQGGFSRAGLRDGRDADPEFALGRPSHLKLYNHGYAIGLQWIAADFGGWLAALGQKLARFANGATLGFGARDLPFALGGMRRAVDMTTPEGGWWARGLMLALLALGAWLARRRPERAIWLVLIGYKLAVTLAFYGYARQAASIAPAFAVLMALALAAGFEALESRSAGLARATRVAGWLALASLVAVDANFYMSGVLVAPDSASANLLHYEGDRVPVGGGHGPTLCAEDLRLIEWSGKGSSAER